MSAFVVKNVKHTQPYFKAYCLANNLKNGDEWNAVDYMSWIENKHRVFKHIHKYTDNYLPLRREHEQVFVEWLFACAQEEQEHTITQNAETCVCCGDVIPESRQVCPRCEAEAAQTAERR